MGYRGRVDVGTLGKGGSEVQQGMKRPRDDAFMVMA